MDRTQLLQHFDTLAETPEAVAKLRHLVVELAARGVFGGAGAKSVLLGTEAQFVMGQAPPGTECNTNGDGTIFVKAGEFGVLYPEVCCWTTKPLKFAKKGDVLICVVGATVGKLNLAIDSAIGRSVAAIRPSERLDTRYLYYTLMPFTLRLRGASRGSAQGVIGKQELNAVKILLPPLAEQRRIVAKVEELLALCNELEARQTAARDQRTLLVRSALDRLTTAQTEPEFRQHAAFVLRHSDLVLDSVSDLRTVVSSLAVQGRLVPRNPKDGKGAEVVNKFSLREQPDAGQILDLALPDHWAITAFSNIAHIRSGVTKGRILTARKTKSFPYLRVANVQRGYLELDVMKDIEIPVEELAKFRLQSNDLLITEGGDWDKVGRTAIWREKIADCIHQNHVFRARLVSADLKPEWFMLYLNSPVGRRYFESASKQTTNLASINATELRGCPVPVPPLAEQLRIVAKVDELMRWCDALEARLAAAQTAASALLDATLHEILAA